MSKRDEIAQRVLGKLIQKDAGEAPAPGATPRPRPMNTFIGKAGEEVAQGYAARVDKLERERAQGLVVLKLDPKSIRFSRIANRHERSLRATDEDFAALRQDLLDNGQEFPIKVKAVNDEPGCLYEVVSGHRRLKACQELDLAIPGGFPVYAVLDAQANELKTHALKMYRENAIRKDLSAFETGRMFRRWLEEKLFSTQAELAAAVKLDPASVTQYLAVGDLPSEVLKAFGDPRAISQRWMQTLSPALKASRAAVLAEAARLANATPRPSPDAVLAALVAAGRPGKRRGGPEAETVKLGGKSLYTISWKGSRVGLKFGKQVEAGLVEEAQDALKQFLTGWLKKRLKP